MGGTDIVIVKTEIVTIVGDRPTRVVTDTETEVIATVTDIMTTVSTVDSNDSTLRTEAERKRIRKRSKC